MDATVGACLSSGTFPCALVLGLRHFPRKPYKTPRSLRHQPATSKRLSQTLVAALNIDRRRHLELAWERQEAAEVRLRQDLSDLPSGKPLEVVNLAHLERLLELAGSSIVVVGFYSRSCGVCKEVMKQFEELCREAGDQRAGVLFLKHNVHNEFDDYSDAARMYNIRAVPRFLCFVGGALVKQVTMTDSRRFVAPRAQMQGLLIADVRRLRATIWELLLKNAPSARK